MSLTVGVDTYTTIAEADTYWGHRNNSTWANATDANKKKALREATQYLDGHYTFIGCVSSYEQALAFPRTDLEILYGNRRGVVYNSTDIPQPIKDATAQLAINALSGELRPPLARGGQIKREKVDVLEVEYADYASPNTSYEFVTMLLSGLIIGRGHEIKLVRA